MAQKKQHMSARDYEAAEANESVDVDSVAHHFVLVDGEEKPQPVNEISAEEQERRELKARFKKLHGYKPTTKDLKELHRMVAEAEQRHQLKRDGIG